MKMLWLIFVLGLASCSKNKANKEVPFIIDLDLIAKERERIIQEKIKETLEENRVETEVVEEPQRGFFRRLGNGIVNLFRSDDFDIVFPKALSDKIVDEIMASIYSNLAFNPQEFWNLLSPQTSIELNRVLLNRYLEVSDEEFEEVRNLAAFAYLFYFQLEERKKGYELFLENQEIGVDRIKVAFDESAEFDNRERLSLVEKLNVEATGFHSALNYMRPSEILGQVVCEKGENKIFIEQYTDEARGTLFQINEGESFRVRLPRDTQIDEDASNVNIKMKVSSLDLDFELDIERKTRPSTRSVFDEYRKNSFRYLALEGSYAGDSFDLKRLRCSEKKNVIYQR